MRVMGLISLLLSRWISDVSRVRADDKNNNASGCGLQRLERSNLLNLAPEQRTSAAIRRTQRHRHQEQNKASFNACHGICISYFSLVRFQSMSCTLQVVAPRKSNHRAKLKNRPMTRRT